MASRDVELYHLKFLAGVVFLAMDHETRLLSFDDVGHYVQLVKSLTKEVLTFCKLFCLD